MQILMRWKCCSTILCPRSLEKPLTYAFWIEWMGTVDGTGANTQTLCLGFHAENRKEHFFFRLIGENHCRCITRSTEKNLPGLTAFDRLSEDPGSIPGGAALCFFRLIQLSVHIFVGEEKERVWFYEMVLTGTNFQFEQILLNPASFRRLGHPGHIVVKKWRRFGERQKNRTQFLSWLCSTAVKGALSRYSVFFVDFFFCRKWWRGDSRPRRRPMRSRPLPHFFFFACSKLCDQSTSEYQAVTLAKSFLSRTKLGFEIRSRKWKQKGKFAVNNGENFMESKTGLQSSTDRSWAVLVRQSFKTCHLSGAFVYFATQYNVHYDNRLAGHLLSALRLKRFTAAIIFPHNKVAQKITE